MGKVLKILGVVFLILVAVVVAAMVWAQRSGAALQKRFFEAVMSGDSKQVAALFHPVLLEKVDEPVLAAWVAAVKAHLGAFKGLSRTNFSTRTEYKDGAQITESKGTVEFEKGQAETELTFRGEQLVAFHVKSKSIPADSFKGPASTELYRERGKEFLASLMSSQQDRAFKMMHESLQKKAPPEKLKAMAEPLLAGIGLLKAVSYQSEKLDADGRCELRIRYTMEGEKGTLPAQVRFEFEGLKGHLVAFAVGREEAEREQTGRSLDSAPPPAQAPDGARGAP